MCVCVGGGVSVISETMTCSTHALNIRRIIITNLNY